MYINCLIVRNRREIQKVLEICVLYVKRKSWFSGAGDAGGERRWNFAKDGQSFRAGAVPQFDEVTAEIDTRLFAGAEFVRLYALPQSHV